MGDKNECPICSEVVNPSIIPDCYECMTCHQKIHGHCELEWNQTAIKLKKQNGDDIFLRDYILTCPVCRKDRIAYCDDLGMDINEDMKAAVAENPNRRGGRKARKTRKSRKSKKSRKSRKSKKSRKSRK